MLKLKMTTQIVMKFKNLNSDETQKLKLWWDLKPQIVMKLKNSNRDETTKLKLWWNSTQIVMKLMNSSCDEIQKSSYDESQKLKL